MKSVEHNANYKPNLMKQLFDNNGDSVTSVSFLGSVYPAGTNKQFLLEMVTDCTVHRGNLGNRQVFYVSTSDPDIVVGMSLRNKVHTVKEYLREEISSTTGHQSSVKHDAKFILNTFCYEHTS